MSDKIDYLILPDGQTIKTDDFRQAITTITETIAPVVTAMRRLVVEFYNELDNRLTANPAIAAYLRQHTPRRGLVHGSSRVGRERRR